MIDVSLVAEESAFDATLKILSAVCAITYSSFSHLWPPVAANERLMTNLVFIIVDCSCAKVTSHQKQQQQQYLEARRDEYYFLSKNIYI